MNILKVENLCKKIGKKEILNNVNLEINSGDIMAFIGPNGAGKTTAIKCILGLQKMTSGKVTINGHDIKKDFVSAIEHVGCIVESPDVYLYLTGYENLKLQASLYKDIKEEEIMRVIKLVGLRDCIHEKVSKYSLGMRERLGIAIALLNYPKLLILDEPTNGLDPEGIKDLRKLLVNIAKSGTGILISSHNLSELESFCNKVCIISNGKIIETNNISEIKKIDENKYIIKVDDTNLVKKFLNKEDSILDKNYFMVIKDEKDVAKFIKLLVNKNINIYEVKKETLSLEEAFINKAGGKNG
ncbi:MAG: ABC transporter ATP-binding protein [Firmicutes bacterium]|nr:ABC transporter ATP-binding protein [Bacillota bacterium]